jgi:DinB family protein
MTEGTWLGEGDPDGGFAADFEQLTEAWQRTYVRRLDWMEREFMEVLSRVPLRELREKPAQGRPLLQILGHVAGAQYGYLQGPLSKPAGLAAAVRAVEQGPDPLGAFEACRTLWLPRLEAITAEERTAQVRHGVKVVTARRVLRRSLEHQWEHLVEVRERLGAG